MVAPKLKESDCPILKLDYSCGIPPQPSKKGAWEIQKHSNWDTISDIACFIIFVMLNIINIVECLSYQL